MARSPLRVRGVDPFGLLQEQIRRNLGILPKPDFRMNIEETTPETQEVEDFVRRQDPNFVGPLITPPPETLGERFIRHGEEMGRNQFWNRQAKDIYESAPETLGSVAMLGVRDPFLGSLAAGTVRAGVTGAQRALENYASGEPMQGERIAGEMGRAFSWKDVLAGGIGHRGEGPSEAGGVRWPLRVPNESIPEMVLKHGTHDPPSQWHAVPSEEVEAGHFRPPHYRGQLGDILGLFPVHTSPLHDYAGGFGNSHVLSLKPNIEHLVDLYTPFSSEDYARFHSIGTPVEKKEIVKSWKDHNKELAGLRKKAAENIYEVEDVANKTSVASHLTKERAEARAAQQLARTGRFHKVRKSVTSPLSPGEQLILNGERLTNAQRKAVKQTSGVIGRMVSRVRADVIPELEAKKNLETFLRTGYDAVKYSDIGPEEYGDPNQAVALSNVGQLRTQYGEVLGRGYVPEGQVEGTIPLAGPAASRGVMVKKETFDPTTLPSNVPWYSQTRLPLKGVEPVVTGLPELRRGEDLRQAFPHLTPDVEIPYEETSKYQAPPPTTYLRPPNVPTPRGNLSRSTALGSASAGISPSTSAGVSAGNLSQTAINELYPSEPHQATIHGEFQIAHPNLTTDQIKALVNVGHNVYDFTNSQSAANTANNLLNIPTTGLAPEQAEHIYAQAHVGNAAQKHQDFKTKFPNISDEEIYKLVSNYYLADWFDNEDLIHSVSSQFSNQMPAAPGGPGGLQTGSLASLSPEQYQIYNSHMNAGMSHESAMQLATAAVAPPAPPQRNDSVITSHFKNAMPSLTDAEIKFLVEDGKQVDDFSVTSEAKKYVAEQTKHIETNKWIDEGYSAEEAKMMLDAGKKVGDFANQEAMLNAFHQVQGKPSVKQVADLLDRYFTEDLSQPAAVNKLIQDHPELIDKVNPEDWARFSQQWEAKEAAAKNPDGTWKYQSSEGIPYKGDPRELVDSMLAADRDILEISQEIKDAIGITVPGSDLKLVPQEIHDYLLKAFSEKHHLNIPFDASGKMATAPPAPAAKPTNAVEQLEALKKYPEVAENLVKDSGTEMGSIESHTKDVIKEWANQLSDAELDEIGNRWGTTNLKSIMDIALPLHDIGKANAIAAEGKHMQHEHTIPIMKKIMQQEGFIPEDINLAVELFNHDLLGNLVNPAGTPTTGQQVAAQLIQKAAKVGMDPADFAKLQLAVFHADAGAYPYIQQFMKKSAKGGWNFDHNPKMKPILDLAKTPKTVTVGGGGGEVQTPKKQWEDLFGGDREAAHHYSDVAPDKFDDLTKVEPQRGSNIGGVYKNSEGTKYYVKQPKDPTQNFSEQLANDIYIDLGFGVPTTVIGEMGGKSVLRSRWRSNLKQLGHDISPTDAARALKGWAADYFMANYDAAGRDTPNLHLSQFNNILRIDQGGALLHRGTGAQKTADHIKMLQDTSNWTKRTAVNRYAELWGRAGIPSPDKIPGIRDYVDDVLSLRPQDGWHEYVQARIPEAPIDYKLKVTDFLESQTKLMLELKRKLGR